MKPMFFHDEIILRFNKGHLSEVIIDGEKIVDAVGFEINAHCRSVATFSVERSTVYSKPKQILSDLGSQGRNNVD